MVARKIPVEIRLMSQIERIPFSGCWIWMGGTVVKGYGALIINNKSIYAHRLSYSIHNGEIPHGMMVCHTCDVTLCVNPNHLFLGTAFDNNMDKVSKGRQIKGDDHPMMKVTNEEVMEIRRLHVKGSHKYGSAALARKFNISQIQIWNIVNFKQRKD